jgi:hypothetical protein
MVDPMAAILVEPMDEAGPTDMHEGMDEPEVVFTLTWAQLEKLGSAGEASSPELYGN